MSDNFNHLSLALQKDGKKKVNKKQKILPPKIVQINKANRSQHSSLLNSQAKKQIEIWDLNDKKRIENNLPEFTKNRPILVRISPEEYDIDFFRSTFQMEVVCEYEDGIVIVASDKRTFSSFINKINDFALNVKGSGNIARICDIFAEESNEERLKRILSEELIDIWHELKNHPEELVTVEVSIECLGTVHLSDKPLPKKDEDELKFQKRFERWEKKRNVAYILWDELLLERSDEVETLLRNYRGEVLECSHDPNGNMDSFELKIRVSIKGFIDFTENYPYVFDIDFPTEVERNETYSIINGTSNLPFEIIEPNTDSATVCVIDSGIQEGHAYLEQSIRRELSHSYIGTSEVNDEVEEGGHGTRVAGAILYPYGIDSAITKYQLPCFIANARVLNDANCIPENLLPSRVLNDLFNKYYVEEGIRIYNHSINGRVPYRKKYMSAWASTIDNACFENDILFLQSAGNINANSNNPFCLGLIQHIKIGREYPTYLQEASCAISNPAQSLQALTVGSICCGEYEDHDFISFGKKDQISAFSRTGFGIWNSIKPEVVEYGGDYVTNKTTKDRLVFKEDTCPELLRRSPEGPAYAKDCVGTSFSAPKVAHIAAALQKELPNQTALLYKALIVQSARWTSWARTIEPLQALKYMGYGVPDIERATTNNEYRVTYITNGERTILGNNVHIYKVKIPDQIKNLGNLIRIDVTMTFAAKPRRTRKGFKGYFSTWVEWKSSRFGEDINEFADRVIQSEEDEIESVSDMNRGKAFKWTLASQDKHGQIQGGNRNRSATQKDWTIIPAYELPDEFSIAVQGHYGWSKSSEHYAKYALAISFEAINNDIEIYNLFEVQSDVTIESEQEIESEIEISNL